MPGQKTEISSLDEEFRTFLHSLGNNTERFYRGLKPGTAGIEVSSPCSTTALRPP